MIGGPPCTLYENGNCVVPIASCEPIGTTLQILIRPRLMRFQKVTTVSPCAPYGTETVIVRFGRFFATSRSAGSTVMPPPGASGSSS